MSALEQVAASELEAGQRFRVGMLAGVAVDVRPARAVPGAVRLDYSDTRERRRVTFLDGATLVTLEAEGDAPSVWDASVPPGGEVCSVCGMPTETEPCREHQPRAYGEMGA